MINLEYDMVRTHLVEMASTPTTDAASSIEQFDAFLTEFKSRVLPFEEEWQSLLARFKYVSLSIFHLSSCF
jgi:hypothetical protein